jgi:Tfp pilus assembly protein PilF/predicted AlkP superfamily phosphohydrolase/phosphomutase
VTRAGKWVWVLAAVAIAAVVVAIVWTRSIDREEVLAVEGSVHGGEPLPEAGFPDRKFLVIGLDGADWDIIDPMIEQGKLPNLARLAEGGVRARLRTITPILSPVVWTSVATGKGPSKHGIYDFLAQASDGSMVPVTSSLRKSKALWNILGDAGIPVAITAWWATWPAEPVRGYVVTDRIAYQLFKHMIAQTASDGPAADKRGKTWPEGLFDEILPLVVDQAEILDSDVGRFVDLDALGRPDEDDRERLDEFRTVLASTRTYETIGVELLRRQPSGFHSIYNESTDTAAHLFMPFRPPRRPEVDARRAAAFGGLIDAIYEEADAMVGRVLDTAGPGWTVMVLSDHGFKHADNRPSTDPRVDRGPGADWHDRFGILILHGPDIRKGVSVADATVLDVAPTILALYGLPVGEDMDGRVLEEAIEPKFLSAHPVESTPTYERGTREETEIERSPQDDQMMARLQALGYIAGPAEDEAPGGQTFTQDSSRAHNNRGVVLLARRDLDGALAEFQKALEAGGGVQALVNLTHTHVMKNDLDRAEATLSEIERVAPGARMIPGLRGAIADLRGDDARAEAYLREAIGLDPADSRSRTRLGHLLEESGKLDEALEEYRAAVRANPENAEANNYAGNILRLRGELDEAERYYRKALDTDPWYPGAYNNLGLLLQQTGRSAEAIGLYRKGLELAPGSALLHNSLGSLLIMRRKMAEAEREVREAIEIAPEMAEARNNLGILLAEKGLPEDARREFEKAIDADPALVDARFNLGKVLLLLGDRNGALASFAKALDLHPQHLEAAIGAGEIAFRQGRKELAIRYFERADRIKPGIPRVRDRLSALGR